MEVSFDFSANVENAVDSVINDLKSRAREAGKWAADELTMEAQNAIEDFYGWTPSMYNRNGGLKNSYKRYYSNKHGNIIYGGVELLDSTSNYRSVISGKGVSNAFVTMLAWFAGRHGFAEAFPAWMHVHNYPPVMSPTPHERVIKRYHEVESEIMRFFE